MTVAEVISQLSTLDHGMNVYVPDFDGTTQIAKQVAQFPHLNTPPGVSIPDDVWILPWVDGENEIP